MLGTLLLLIASVTGSWAADYELLLEDPDIFSPCTEPPPGSMNINKALKLDNLVLDQEGDIIHFSENITTDWDVQPSDRISVNEFIRKRARQESKQTQTHFRPGSPSCTTSAVLGSPPYSAWPHRTFAP